MYSLLPRQQKLRKNLLLQQKRRTLTVSLLLLLRLHPVASAVDSIAVEGAAAAWTPSISVPVADVLDLVLLMLLVLSVMRHHAHVLTAALYWRCYYSSFMCFKWALLLGLLLFAPAWCGCCWW